MRAIASVMRQTLKPAEIILFDTDSSDGAIERARALIKKIPLRYRKIAVSEFDHGGTRNAALKLVKHPWVLYMTQDAVCADEHSFAVLLSAAIKQKTVAAYARQLPHENATPLAATARFFNYGSAPIVQNMAAASRLGIKTWFCSNSFCLWNTAALRHSGGFAEKLILGEDMHAAARLIQAGGTVLYVPTANAMHSHNYSAVEEFRRYFDIGVFHINQSALLFVAGNANKEGFKFVKEQMRLLYERRALFSLVRLPFHIAAKFLGYKLGRKYTLLGKKLSRFLSMHRAYWGHRK